MASKSRAPKDPLATFRSHLNATRNAVDDQLAALWDDTRNNLSRHGGAVLHMADAARDLTLRGGKRFRAAMLVAAYSGVAPRAAVEPALTAAVALELLQSYLLIQDDWMDGDPTRRGGPSAHAALTEVWGSAHLGACSAILASDLTWSLSVRTLASAKLSAKRRLRAIDLFCGVHQDVVAGQQIDMLGRAEDVEAMHELKTGSYTLRGPLLLGATLAGAPKRALKAFTRYAAPLGVAFQLRDDLLGAFGKEADTGKREGNDLRAGKKTALLAAAAPLLSGPDKEAIDLVFGRADASDDDVKKAIAALEQCGARSEVEARLHKLCDEGALLADELPVSRRAKLIFVGAAHALRV
ncbi:MAG: polyprenyl synthetase family protein [Polyangiaceae bacterium]|nr:polyprenyl synthetase family protein [Polyangiaceae bacterium]